MMDELDTSVYQCSKCLNKLGEARIPCTVVMGSGEIPDHCLYDIGGTVEWKCLQT